jgi:prepilin-type N-terminal cleavage/methylation domain-containing protein
MTNTNKGFSLIELILVITVFSVIMVGILPLYFEALKGQTVIREQTQAAGILMELRENILGECRTDGLDGIDDTNFPNSPQDIDIGESTIFKITIISINGASPTGSCTGSPYQIVTTPADAGKCIKVSISNIAGEQIMSDEILVFAGPPESQKCP